MKTYGISAVSIIVNKFVTQIISNTEKTKRGISQFNIEHTSKLQLSIWEKYADLRNCNEYWKCYSSRRFLELAFS